MDRAGAVLRAAGLGGVSRSVRNLLDRVTPGVEVDVEGLRMRGGILDRSFLYRVREGVFEPATVRRFASAIRPGAVVVDVGAYLGFYTLLAAARAGPSGFVVAVEPDPRALRFLRRNVRGLTNVNVVAKAASDRSGFACLYENSSDPSRASLARREGNEGEVSVDAWPVDWLLSGRAVDVVKIDVEGTECAVLRGMRKTLANSRDPAVFIELNPRALREAGSSTDELLGLIDALGFRAIQRLDEEYGAGGELLLCNLYCRRSDGGATG